MLKLKLIIIKCQNVNLKQAQALILCQIYIKSKLNILLARSDYFQQFLSNFRDEFIQFRGETNVNFQNIVNKLSEGFEETKDYINRCCKTLQDLLNNILQYLENEIKEKDEKINELYKDILDLTEMNTKCQIELLNCQQTCKDIENCKKQLEKCQKDLENEKTENSKLITSTTTLAATNAAQLATIGGLTAALAKSQAEAKACEISLAAAQATIAGLEATIAAKDAELSSLTATNMDLRQANQELISANQQLTLTNDTNANTIKDLRAELAEADALIEKKNEIINQKDDEINRLTYDNTRLQDLNDELQHDLDETKDELAECKDDRDRFKKLLEECQEELEQCQDKLKELEEEMKTLYNCSEIQNKIDQINTQWYNDVYLDDKNTLCQRIRNEPFVQAFITQFGNDYNLTVTETIRDTQFLFTVFYKNQEKCHFYLSSNNIVESSFYYFKLGTFTWQQLTFRSQVCWLYEYIMNFLNESNNLIKYNPDISYINNQICYKK